jgi:glycerophosphoryl diester phosphodiesterase
VWKDLGARNLVRLINWGVDGLISDRPDLALDI